MCLQSHLQFVMFIWFMLSWLAMFYVFRKKWSFCELFCVLICVDIRIMKVVLSLVRNPTFEPTTLLDLMCFSSYFKQWPSDLPMESYVYFLLIYKYKKNIFFSKINAYLNILNQIYISLYSSNKFSSTDGILCVFSLIFKYQEECLFRLSIFPIKTI